MGARLQAAMANSPVHTCCSVTAYHRVALLVAIGHLHKLLRRQGAHVWPSSVASGCSGARTSHTLMLLSTDAVASTQSLYLHQSALCTPQQATALSACPARSAASHVHVGCHSVVPAVLCLLQHKRLHLRREPPQLMC